MQGSVGVASASTTGLMTAESGLKYRLGDSRVRHQKILLLRFCFPVGFGGGVGWQCSVRSGPVSVGGIQLALTELWGLHGEVMLGGLLHGVAAGLCQRSVLRECGCCQVVGMCVQGKARGSRAG